MTVVLPPSPTTSSSAPASPSASAPPSTPRSSTRPLTRLAPASSSRHKVHRLMIVAGDCGKLDGTAFAAAVRAEEVYPVPISLGYMSPMGDWAGTLLLPCRIKIIRVRCTLSHSIISQALHVKTSCCMNKIFSDMPFLYGSSPIGLLIHFPQRPNSYILDVCTLQLARQAHPFVRSQAPASAPSKRNLVQKARHKNTYANNPAHKQEIHKITPTAPSTYPPLVPFPCALDTSPFPSERLRPLTHPPPSLLSLVRTEVPLAIEMRHVVLRGMLAEGSLPGSHPSCGAGMACARG